MKIEAGSYITGCFFGENIETEKGEPIFDIVDNTITIRMNNLAIITIKEKEGLESEVQRLRTENAPDLSGLEAFLERCEIDAKAEQLPREIRKERQEFADELRAEIAKLKGKK